MEKVIILGAKPIEHYFRKDMFRFADQNDIELIYMYMTNKKIMLTLYIDSKFKSKEINIWELRKYKNPKLMLFNFGLGSFIKFLIFKILLSPKKLYWDYIDNLYYGNETIKNFLYHKLYEKVSDGVLVLNKILSYRFENAIEFGNASHVDKIKKEIPNTNIVTIASIDTRFDFDIYEAIVSELPQFKFKLYGWVKNDNPELLNVINNRLRKFKNFQYLGKYNNEQLNNILSDSFIGFIPYKVSEYTLYINPDKYYHYSNAGLRIISSFIPALCNKINVDFYTNKSELKEAILNNSQKEYIFYTWEDNIKTIRDLI